MTAWFLSFGDYAFKILLGPTDKATLAGFYCVYILAYVIGHIVWDIKTTRTPAFHFGRLREKTDVLHSAVTMTSSWLLLLTIWQPGVEKITNETMVPIILAGFAGILYGFGKLCPYDICEPVSPTPAGEAN
jgi:hypothetical protein